MDRIRTRALWIVVGIVTTAVGVIAWTTLPAWPVVGVAVATLYLAVHTVASKFSINAEVCLGCGHSLADQPSSENGTFCPGCGLVNQPRPMSLAKTDARRTLDVMRATEEKSPDRAG